VGRILRARRVRDAEGAFLARPGRRLIRTTTWLAPALVVASGPLSAQSVDGGDVSRWDVIATIGAARASSDFAAGDDGQWTATGGVRAGYRPMPLVAFAAEAWRGSLDRGGDVWGAGGHLVVLPLAGRPLPVQPVLEFGLEGISADDDEDRSVAFVFGAGIEVPIASRFFLALSGRQHFLSIDEEPEPVPGDPGRTVDTGRDASVLELRTGLGVTFGGSP